MSNRYTIVAALVVIAVYASYIINFYFYHGYEISSETEIWAQLGDYAGGLLNPLLSFVTIVLLIKSIVLQADANGVLSDDFKGREKTEKTRSFEILFFNMIDSQKKLFESLSVDFNDGGSVGRYSGAKAVFEIEDSISVLRDKGVDDAGVSNYLGYMDLHDQIFGVSRAFYIAVKMVNERISDSDEFSTKDRKEYYQTLMNFTDFSQIRLVLICVQFMDYPAVKYLKGDVEFNEVVNEIGLAHDLY